MKATNVGVDPDLMEEHLRTAAKSARKRGKKWRRHYTIVPRIWELRLQNTTRICAYRLAHELLYQRFRLDQDAFTRDLSIVVSNAMAKAAGISTRTKTNALNELVRLGLIEVVRKSRRSPRVTLLRIEVLRR